METGIRSERDLLDFLVAYTRDMVEPEQDPADVLARYLVPDFEFCNDGLVIDRERMLAHARGMRRRVTSSDVGSVDVHEAVLSGDRFAARCTLDVAMSKGGDFRAEVYMFGRLAADGRIRRVDQTTSDLTPKN
ncbi:nuclear transport factor 2 family protein [Actinomadura logoneensis]|uniref:Nuclear transport factor 2 family protein n=1 Tax=Actinomadura logoneensis TaxID=2293572 RepID=A0A372JMU2_9ACTN|nr:nuclear transport factor 2 family protein [Actinomadura logoneensis]RFU41343.1 nuclear transport factor 2 family protein [Actinomadura logoneensis]